MNFKPLSIYLSLLSLLYLATPLKAEITSEVRQLLDTKICQGCNLVIVGSVVG